MNGPQRADNTENVTIYPLSSVFYKHRYIKADVDIFFSTE